VLKKLNNFLYTNAPCGFPIESFCPSFHICCLLVLWIAHLSVAQVERLCVRFYEGCIEWRKVAQNSSWLNPLICLLGEIPSQVLITRDKRRITEAQRQVICLAYFIVTAISHFTSPLVRSNILSLMCYMKGFFTRL